MNLLSHPLPRFFISIGIFLLVACSIGSKNVNQPLPVPFTKLAQGQQSNLSLEKHLIIQSNRSWGKLWRAHNGGRELKPVVDFSREMVIAIFTGQKNTGGYKVDIQDININNSGMTVNVIFYKPSPGSIVTMALTQPYVIIKTQKYDGKVDLRITSK